MKKPSIAEPVTDLKRIPILENGDPLVDFLQYCPDLALSRPRFTYRRTTFLRREVADKLCRATRLLPNGYRIVVVEGWRPLHIQRRMYLAVWQQFKELHPTWTDHQLKRIVNQFSAPLSARVPPPHVTGGAVDLMLANSAGEELDHSSPYDHYDPKSFHFDAVGLSEDARRTRETLREVLNEVGITNYPSEYWHWSFGDQGWAYRGHHPHAIYGAVTPEGWRPNPEEDIDEPLTMVHKRSD